MWLHLWFIGIGILDFCKWHLGFVGLQPFEYIGEFPSCFVIIVDALLLSLPPFWCILWVVEEALVFFLPFHWAVCAFWFVSIFVLTLLDAISLCLTVQFISICQHLFRVCEAFNNWLHCWFHFVVDLVLDNQFVGDGVITRCTHRCPRRFGFAKLCGWWVT